jgi:hypothetical protein
MPELPSMSDREVWVKASIVAAEFGDDDADDLAARFADILRDIADPPDWRRVAAAIGLIAEASKQ